MPTRRQAQVALAAVVTAAEEAFGPQGAKFGYSNRVRRIRAAANEMQQACGQGVGNYPPNKAEFQMLEQACDAAEWCAEAWSKGPPVRIERSIGKRRAWVEAGTPAHDRAQTVRELNRAVAALREVRAMIQAAVALTS